MDGTSKDGIPTTPKDASKSNYYKVTATCDNGIKAEWDYNAWNLKVEDIQKGTKCKLAFNSTLTEEDYQEYIEAGVAYRRNTYRGKDITSKLEDGTLFSEIESGKFDDIFVGDYIVDKKTNLKDMNGNQIRYLVADIDNYLNPGTGKASLTKHHATIIPAVSLMTAKMNETDTTENGYAGSNMVATTLTTILNTYIKPVFDNHIIEYGNMLTTKIDRTRTNRYGIANGGVSSAWVWYDRQLDLMSEMNVFGSTIWSSSGHDTGIDNRQYAIFKLKPIFIYSYGNKTFTCWLKDVVSSAYFADIDGNGLSANGGASTSFGVRPRFLID